MITRPLRPAPSDLDSIAARYSSVRDIAKHYGTGPRQATRWLKEYGLARGIMQPAPDDLAEMAKIMGVRALSRHYDVGEKIVRRWLNEGGITPYFGTRPRRPMPDDFMEVAPTLTLNGICTHYKAGKGAAMRWVEEAGITPAAPVQSIPKCSGGNVRPSRGTGASNVVKIRTTSIHDEAADELRRNRWQVNRCDEKGLYAENGKLWRVGTVICTPDELLARAERCRRRAA